MLIRLVLAGLCACALKSSVPCACVCARAQKDNKCQRSLVFASLLRMTTSQALVRMRGHECAGVSGHCNQKVNRPVSWKLEVGNGFIKTDIKK